MHFTNTNNKMRFTLASALQLVFGLAIATEAQFGAQRVLYNQDNDPNGNSLIASVIHNDGTISSGTRTSTGGTGLLLLLVDHGNSVIVSGNVRNATLFPYRTPDEFSNRCYFSVSVHSKLRKRYRSYVHHRSFGSSSPSHGWQANSHSRPESYFGCLLAQIESR